MQEHVKVILSIRSEKSLGNAGDEKDVQGEFFVKDQQKYPCDYVLFDIKV